MCSYRLFVYDIIAVILLLSAFLNILFALSLLVELIVSNSLSSPSLCLSQFEDFVMDICFEILENSKNALKNLAKDIERRRDPVYVSRIIAAMVTY